MACAIIRAVSKFGHNREDCIRLAIFLTFMLVSVIAGQVPEPKDEDSMVTVLGFKYLTTVKLNVPKQDTPVPPASAMIPEDKYFRRTARQMDPPNAIQPKDYTIDGRSAALEKNVNDARSAPPSTANGYSYQLKFRNDHTQKIEVIFWEYQRKEIANPANVTRRQFLCGVKVGPSKEIEVTAFSTLGLSDVVNVTIANIPAEGKFSESVQINRVEYANGSILQRRDWDHKAIKPAVDRALSVPWEKETCRAL